MTFQVTINSSSKLAYSDLYVAAASSAAKSNAGAWPEPEHLVKLDVKFRDYCYELTTKATNVEKFTAIISTFQQLAALRKNWDSYGALPLSHKSWASALRTLFVACDAGAECPYIGLTNTGGVHLEWSRSGRSLEIEIEGDARQFGYLIDGNEVREIEQITRDDILTFVRT